MIKLLHIALREGGGGPADLVETINQGFAESGIEVTMVYLRQPTTLLPKTAAVHKIGLGLTTRTHPLFNWQACHKISHLLRTGDFDVVLSHRYKPCMLLMKLVRKFSKTQFINVVHGTQHYNRPSRKRAILRLAHDRFHFVCVSDAVADFIRDECEIGNTASSIETIPNGIDIHTLDSKQLSRAEARRKLNLDLDSLWIGFAGRLIKIKGIAGFVRGFSQITKSYPDIKLCVLGDGVLRNELKEIIEKKGLQNRIKLTGNIPQAHRYFKAFDAFTLPSYREGLSIALIEAMASGLPLLISDIPMNTTVADSNAIIFTPRDVGSIKKALIRFLEKTAEQRKLDGQKNRLLAEEKYDIRLFKKNYVKLLIRQINILISGSLLYY